VSLLTGGSDRPYAFGLMTALLSRNVTLDLIGSDELNTPEFNARPGVNFLHFRGDQNPNASLASKMKRIALLYARLIRYAATAKPRIFHILWNNKFEYFDRTLLMFCYKLVGRKTVLTVHNVNTAKRNHTDTALNRLTLQVQYRLADHIFVHTEQMKAELLQDYGVRESRATVIPFGINNSIPTTAMSGAEARERLGLSKDEKVLLFFGRIAPYKGIEYLITALRELAPRDRKYRLLVAGRPHDSPKYAGEIADMAEPLVKEGRIVLRAEHVPESEMEMYFKAADALVLPYKQIYQSGVLFLAYSFGLPVLAADVGSLKDDMVEGKTGFMFRSEDSQDLAKAIEKYFASDLYAELDSRRPSIMDYAERRHSWDTVSQMTLRVYASLLGVAVPEDVAKHEAPGAPLDLHVSP